MSRDVRNMFLTSVDKVDDFIYWGYTISDGFRAKTEKGGSAGGGQICPHGRTHYVGAARWALGPHNAH